jgi:hypothetical protein
VLLRLSREADVSAVLSRIGVPVLVLHRSGDRCVGIENARDLAGVFPSQDWSSLPGADRLPHIGGTARLAAEIAGLLELDHPLRNDPGVSRVLSTNGLKRPCQEPANGQS